MEERCKRHSGRVNVAGTRPFAGHVFFWGHKNYVWIFSEARLSVFLLFKLATKETLINRFIKAGKQRTVLTRYIYAE